MNYIEKQLKQQDDYIKECKKANDNWALASTTAFWQSMTSVHFKNFALALAEGIDNSKQAAASIISVYINKSKEDKKISSIVLADNGHGMNADMLRKAMSYGGTPRHNNREGTGRFGMGMPNFTFTQANRVIIYSKRPDSKDIYCFDIDGKKIESGEYFVDGRIQMPEAKKVTLPADIKELIKSRYPKFEQGTILILKDLERMKIKQPLSLKRHLFHHLGVIFNKSLPSFVDNKEVNLNVGEFNLFVDNERVKPIDPLFITPGAQGFDEDNERAEKFEIINLEVEHDGIKGKVRAEVSRVSPRYWYTEKTSEKVDKSSLIKSRWEVAKAYHGIHFYRNNRLIETLSKIPDYQWENKPSSLIDTWMNNDRTMRVAISFEPILDDLFGVETTKQKIIPDQKIWQALYDADFFAILSECRSRDRAERKELKNNKTGNEDILTPAQEILKKVIEHDDDQKTPEVSDFKTAESKKNAESVHSSKTITEKPILNADPSDDKKQTSVVHNREGYPRVIEVSQPFAPFFSFDWVDEELCVFINKDHSFYTEFYTHEDISVYLRNCIDILLGTLALKMNGAQDTQVFFKNNLVKWSEILENALAGMGKNYSEIKEDVPTAEIT